MRLILAFLALLIPVAAVAEWKEVKTDHFLIYANESDNELRRRAERLEAVHYLMLKAYGLADDPSPVRVKVYFYGDIPTVTKLARMTNAAGYYYPTSAGAIAVVPATDDAESIDTLYHEYAHHFMLQYFPGAYPSWFIEGWAEIIGATSFERKGTISYGKANSGRKVELDYGVWTHVGDLVSKPRSELKKASSESFYGQSWLLTHYLMLSPERSPKLRAYLNHIGRGQSLTDASKAFGDLDQLNKDVRSYFTRAVFEYKAVPMPEGLAADLTMRPLAPSEIDLMKEEIQYRSRMSDDEKTVFADTLRKKTARFGQDIYARQLQGEVELAANNYEQARTIADGLVADAPDNSRALLLKARTEMHFAEAATDPKAAVKAVRDWISKANLADPEDPLPLVAFFDSFDIGGKRPTKLAIEGLREAVRRVPQDDRLRFRLAIALANGADEDQASMLEAIKMLTPIAYDPHGGDGATSAQKLIQQLLHGSDIKPIEEESDDEAERATE